MPEYIAVRCFDELCGMFQGCTSVSQFKVIQKPKSKKFQCRVCSKKQSVIKSYATSFKASDIRPIIQELNMKVGAQKEQTPKQNSTPISEEVLSLFDDTPTSKNQNEVQEKIIYDNKWTKHLTSAELHSYNDSSDNEDESDFTTVLPEISKQTKRSRSAKSKQNQQPLQSSSKKQRKLDTTPKTKKNNSRQDQNNHSSDDETTSFTRDSYTVFKEEYYDDSS